MVGARRAAAALVTVLLLAGCGGGDDSATPTTTRAPTTVARADVDKEKARRVVLTAADVPGFTVDPPDTDDNDTIEEAANACVNNNPLLVRLGEDTDPRGAVSPDFSKGQAQDVGSSATFGESEEEARSAIAALSAPSFAGCFSEAAAAALRTDPTFSNVTVETTRLPTVAAGDQSIGYRSMIRASVRDTPVTFYVDFTFVRRGRAFAVINDLSVSTPFPEADRVRLATTVAGRMAAP